MSTSASAPPPSSPPPPIQPPYGYWTTLDATSDLTAAARYGLCISAVVPRPVAVITTVDLQGNVNCAPFSYTGLMSHDPPIISHGLVLSSARRGRATDNNGSNSSNNSNKKDTLNNIEATERWVVHILSTNYLERANLCSSSLPPGEDETKLAGIDLMPEGNTANGVPRLRDAAVAMECTLWDKREVYNADGVHTTTIVMGQVTHFHIHDSVLRYKGGDKSRPLVDLQALQAVGRAGDVTYWPVGTTEETVVAMERPK